MARHELSKRKVAASTVLEVVVAMVIIIAVLGISMMIYANVMQFSLSAQKLRAQFVLQQEMLRLEGGGDAEQADADQDWQMEKEIVPVPGETTLSHVHLTLYDRNHQKLAELQKIIIKHEQK